MKRCPACNTNYDDPNISFCLSDGTPLEASKYIDDAQTVVNGIAAPHTHQTPQWSQPPARKGSSALKIGVIAVLLIGFFGIAIVGAAGALFYFASQSTNVSGPVPQPAVTPAAEVNKRENINVQTKDLEKLMETAKNIANSQEDIFDGLKDLDKGASVATVNSPKDGFLALRSLPSSAQGERLAKIPHGESVVVYGCAAETEEAGRPGQWCRAIYNGSFGWVFDAWLDRV